MTRQLRDTIDLGKAMNKQPFLYMREGAHMTQPVVNAIKNGTLAGASLSKSALNDTVKALINGNK